MAMAENNGPEGEAPSDVEMGDAGLGMTGGSGTSLAGDGHIMESVEEAPLGNVSLTFDVKPDPDEIKPPSSSPTDVKMAAKKAAPKKKGTAATKKRKFKSARGKASKREPVAEDAQDADEESSDDEIDNGPYCICRGPDDHRWMISCDVCGEWYHGGCIDLDKDVGEKLIERFVCHKCTNGEDQYTKYKKTCSLDGCKNAARLYGKKDKSVFCCNDHCDAWWTAMINTLPTKAASQQAIEVLTQEDFMGLLVGTANQGGWKLGDRPFGNVEGLWANGLPTRAGVLSEEEQLFLQASAAERLALGNEIVQYKKMIQLLDWGTERRQAAIEKGTMTKDSCGYDWRLDIVSVRHQFAAWLKTPDGQGVFTAGKLDDPLGPGEGEPSTRGMCEKKRCAPHKGWYKILLGAVRCLIKETATAAADKLDAEEALREQATIRYERRALQNDWFISHG